MALSQTLEKVSHDHILFRCNTVAAKGALLTYDTANDGFVKKNVGIPAFDDKVAGLLMINVVNRSVPGGLIAPGASGGPTVLGDDTGVINLPRNHNKNETYVSGVIRLLVHGYTESNQISTQGGAVYGPGSGLYLGPDGELTSVAVSGWELVGHCLSGLRDGYVRCFINIV